MMPHPPASNEPQHGLEAAARAHPWLTASVALAVILNLIRVATHWDLDDSFITYQYARNLATGHGFIYSARYATWGTTTPLFTLLLAALGRLGGPIPISARVLDLVALMGQSLLAAHLFSQLGLSRWRPLAVLGIPCLSLMTTSLPGMEYGLYACCNFGAMVFVAAGGWIPAALCAGVAATLRIDGGLIAMFVLAAWLAEGRERGPIIPFLLALGLFPAAWYGYALLQFGQLHPQTFVTRRLEAKAWGYFGPYWIRTYLQPGGALPIALVSLLGMKLAVRRCRRMLWLVAYLATYLAMYSAFKLPAILWYLCTPNLFVIVFAWAGLALAAQTLWRAGRRRRALGLAVAVIACWSYVLFFSAWSAWVDPLIKPTFWTTHWNKMAIYQGIAQWLREDLPPGTVSFATNEIGVLGYYSNQDLIEIGGLVNPEGIPYVPYRYPKLIRKIQAPLLVLPTGFMDDICKRSHDRHLFDDYAVLGKFNGGDASQITVLARRGFFSAANFALHQSHLATTVDAVRRTVQSQ